MRLEYLLYHDGWPVEKDRWSGWPFALVCYDMARVEEELADGEWPDAIIVVELRIGTKRTRMTSGLSFEEWREWMAKLPDNLRKPKKSHDQIIAEINARIEARE